MLRRERHPRRRWVWWGLLLLSLLVGAVLLRSEGLRAPERPDASAVAPVEMPGAVAPEFETLAREEQFLRARGGDRRIPHELCGPETRARMQLEIEELGDNEVTVDPGAWERRTLQTRVGMASWMSKCWFDRGPLLVRSRNGEPLATYDPTRGFRPAK